MTIVLFTLLDFHHRTFAQVIPFAWSDLSSLSAYLSSRATYLGKGFLTTTTGLGHTPSLYTSELSPLSLAVIHLICLFFRL